MPHIPDILLKLHRRHRRAMRLFDSKSHHSGRRHLCPCQGQKSQRKQVNCLNEGGRFGMGIPFFPSKLPFGNELARTYHEFD
jgi:hypothetical protein